MGKVKIYIDFEAISAPFSYAASINNDFPYAYSLAIKKDKEYIKKVFILNSNEVKNIKNNSIYTFIKNKIINDVREILGKPSFPINVDTVEFLGFDPVLEKRILKHNSCFGNKMSVSNVIDFSKNVSLTKLTYKFYKDAEYFPKTKQWVKENFDPTFYNKRHTSKEGKIHDGAIAAFIGLVLLMNNYSIQRSHRLFQKIKIGFFLNEEIITAMINELITYSLDDTTRMIALIENMDYCKELQIRYNKVRLDIQKISNDKNASINIINKLNNFDINLSLKDVVDNLQKDIKEMQKEILSLDNSKAIIDKDIACSNALLEFIDNEGLLDNSVTKASLEIKILKKKKFMKLLKTYNLKLSVEEALNELNKKIEKQSEALTKLRELRLT